MHNNEGGIMGTLRGITLIFLIYCGSMKTPICPGVGAVGAPNTGQYGVSVCIILSLIILIQGKIGTKLSIN